ncbi:Clostripain [Minicystis rosea]|nr:Clostripain [Minicystis rosea]
MTHVAIAMAASGALGCHVGPALPPPRCTDAWREVPVASRTYDFAADAKRTARGNEGYGRFADRLPRRGCVKAWTVLLYMAADAADLGAPALRDLRSIEDPKGSAGSTEQADVIAHLHRPAPAPTVRLHLFRAPDGASGEGIRSPIVETLADDHAAPEESLARFVTWGMERYPAEHYAVIVWGHGLGFRPATSGRVAPVHYDRAGISGGLAFDETAGTALDTPALRRALLGPVSDRRASRLVDLYASDACLMQSVEVAGELAGAARFVVGSEQIEEEYVGLPYRTWLPLLNGSVPLPRAAACAPEDVVCHAAAALPPSQRDEVERGGSAAPGLTLSTVDQAALSLELLPALRRLGDAIDAYVREDDLRRIGLQVLLGLDRGAPRGTPGFRGGTRDVGVFLSRLEATVLRQPGEDETKARTALLDATHAAKAALGKAVIAAALGTRYRAVGFEGMAGLSMWLPHDADELARRAPFFAPSVLHRESPSFRGFLERVLAPPPR